MKLKTFWILFAIISLAALFISSTTQAQDTTEVTTSTVYNDVKSIAPKVEQAILSLSKSLKVTANQVWTILVRQQKVWSICYLILTLSSLLGWYIFTKNNLYIPNPKYDKVNGKEKRWEIKDGYSPEYVQKHPEYAHEWKVYDIEKLALIPNTTCSWFKYVHLLICILLSVFSYVHFSDMLTGFINPEFGAMKTIAELALTLK